MNKKKIFAIVALLVFGLVNAAFASQPRPIQRVTVNLTRRGYQPESFRLKKGILAYVTFVRKTSDECGEVVVLPTYGIRRTLPLNTPVTVKFTPRNTGTFNFACGMDMLRGTIIVN